MNHGLALKSLPLVALFLALSPAALASNTWYVDGVHGSDSNNCKSRQQACKTIGHAISLASSGDSILVADAIYQENLTINVSLNLIGSDAATTIIDGQARRRVVYICNNPVAHVTLARLTIRNGLGGIGFCSGTLTINNSTVSGNWLGGRDASGAGLFNNRGEVAINNSTFEGNHNAGGPAGFGGGIYNAGGTVIINNSTISGNSALYGGGIANGISSTLTINNSTVSRNRAQVGGGGDIETEPGGTVSLQNSIVAASLLGGNCSGTMTSNGYNLSSDGTCSFNSTGDLNDTKPKLGKLGNYGGPTQTIPLLPGSPAIDAGNPNGCTDRQGHLLTTDQRGRPRPDKEDSSGCDMGAYERQKD